MQPHNLEQTEVHQDLGTLIDAHNVMYPEISDYIQAWRAVARTSQTTGHKIG